MTRRQRLSLAAATTLALGTGVVGAAVLGGEQSATVSTVTVRPVADARVQESSPGTNYGGGSLRTDGGSGVRVQSAIRFNVQVSGQIVGATLRLRDSDDPTADGPEVFKTATNTWPEDGVTWANRPLTSGGSLSKIGPIGTGEWASWDVSSAVTGNGSVSLKLTQDSTDGARFYQRESTSPPELVLQVETPSTTTTTTTTTTIPPSPGCTKTLSPGASVEAAANGLSAGQVVCLSPGRYSGQVDFTRGGTVASPATITSLDPANPAVIYGRVVTHPGANNLVLSHLKLENYAPSSLASSVTIASDNVTLSRNEITSDNTVICVNTLNSATYGVAHDTVIDHNRVHDCGPAIFDGSHNHEQGLYLTSHGAVVTNNVIYHNSARGIQLRGQDDAVVHNNIVDGNGEGVLFGEFTTLDNEVYNNIFTNPLTRNNAEQYQCGSNCTGNSFHDNCVWSPSGAGKIALTNVATYNNRVVDPKYVNAAARDYRLQANSPCAAYAPVP
jgi:parallel beta-helix repeat protein